MGARTRDGVLASLRPRALAIACFGLYVVAQVLVTFFSWVEFASQQQQHAQPVTMLGDDGFAWTLLEQTLQNWQSEFLALATLVALTAVLLHRGSKHSRDGNDEVQQRVQAIRRRLDNLLQDHA
jgi:hypothetical protein